MTKPNQWTHTVLKSHGEQTQQIPNWTGLLIDGENVCLCVQCGFSHPLFSLAHIVASVTEAVVYSSKVSKLYSFPTQSETKWVHYDQTALD